MPYKRKRGVKRRRGKRKWRQQKLAVGTVEKIAKRVAQFQIEKKLEPKWSNLQLGFPNPAITGSPITCLLFKSGLYKVNAGIPPVATVQSQFMSRSQHHPQTIPIAVSGAVGAPIDTSSPTRIGDTVEVTGLGVKGMFVMGADCPSCTVRVSLCSASETLGDPRTLLPDLDWMVIRRTISDTEKLNVHKTWNFNFNQTASTEPRRRPFSFYHKMSKRIRYNEGQSTLFPGINENNYQDRRYYLVMYSDIPDEDGAGGLPPLIPNAQLPQVLARNLQFYGRFTCYYRDG